MNKTVTIYTLAHPITNQIFYVGQTTTMLHRRLCNHATSKSLEYPAGIYVKEIIKETGKRPTIEAVDFGDIENRKELEEYWIQQFSAWGFPLENIRHVRIKNYTKRQSSYYTFSEEDYKIIKRLINHGDYTNIGLLCGVSRETIRLILGRQHYKRKMIPKKHFPIILDYYKKKATEIARWVERFEAA